jgi:hypothetical protein
VSENNVLDFYQTLGFEETDIEDGLTALLFELGPIGSYALLTDDDGSIPVSLKQPIVFACYTTDGAFLWSVGFKNSHAFKEIWAAGQTPEQKLAAVQNYRKSSDYYKNS